MKSKINKYWLPHLIDHKLETPGTNYKARIMEGRFSGAASTDTIRGRDLKLHQLITYLIINCSLFPYHEFAIKCTFNMEIFPSIKDWVLLLL